MTDDLRTDAVVAETFADCVLENEPKAVVPLAIKRLARHYLALAAAAEPAPDVETLAKELREAWASIMAAPLDVPLTEHDAWLAVARVAARAAGPRWQDRPTVPGRYATETDGYCGNVYVDDPEEWHANFPRSAWYGPLPSPQEPTRKDGDA